MPAKKILDEQEQNLVIETDQKVRSVDSYVRIKGLGRTMYHRLKYEIRDDPAKKLTTEQWDKLYDNVKF